MTLKFGVLFSLRNPSQWQKPWPQVYQETLEQIVIAEELGFDSVWISEHHGADDGYCPPVVPVSVDTPHVSQQQQLIEPQKSQ